MRHAPWILLLASVLTSAAGGKCDESRVELIVSPLASKTELRTLQIAWDVKEWKSGDWVALHIGSPTAKPAFETRTLFSAGWVSTGVMENRHYLEPNYTSTCLGFWTSYNRANSSTPLVSSCLKTNPRWMEELKDSIGKLRLNDVFLPGTHDTAAFKVAYSPFKMTRFDKYTYAQDETVMEQLIHGARILDLRVGYYNGVFWSNHGIAKVHPFEHTIHDIRDFINNTQEIVILDFHRFPVGFKDNSTHDKLVNYIKDVLRPWIVSPRLSWRGTLNSVWNSGKRVVIAYNDQKTVARHQDVLFPPVSQVWANALNTMSLKEYFTNAMSRPKPNNGWSLMAELTPNTWTVLTDEQGGLRVMAEATNKEVTDWFNGNWGGICNGVAVDYIRSSGIVNAAIKWNQRRANNVRTC